MQKKKKKMHSSHIFLPCVLSGIGILLNSPKTVSVLADPQSFLGLEVPKETPDPINIDSGKVSEMKDLNPINLRVSISEKLTVTNNGKSVEAVLVRPKTDSTITGGVLQEGKYLFERMKYLWVGDTTKFAATTINDKGYPLENIFVFRNEKYPTFSEALQERDGLAVVGVVIDMCKEKSKDSKSDKYIKGVLQKIKEANSAVNTTLGRAFSFAAQGSATPNSTYYAYPGSYFDETTEKRYYCTTVIILFQPRTCISEEQYRDTFGSFTNSAGEPLTDTESQFPRKMPVVEAKGIENIDIL